MSNIESDPTCVYLCTIFKSFSFQIICSFVLSQIRMQGVLVVCLIMCIGAVCSQGPPVPPGPQQPQGFQGIPEFLLPPPLPAPDSK